MQRSTTHCAYRDSAQQVIDLHMAKGNSKQTNETNQLDKPTRPTYWYNNWCMVMGVAINDPTVQRMPWQGLGNSNTLLLQAQLQLHIRNSTANLGQIYYVCQIVYTGLRSYRSGSDAG